VDKPASPPYCPVSAPRIGTSRPNFTPEASPQRDTLMQTLSGRWSSSLLENLKQESPTLRRLRAGLLGALWATEWDVPEQVRDPVVAKWEIG